MESLPNSFVFNFDINKSIIINPYFVQGNVNSSVLEPHLVDAGKVVDITGETIQFRFLKEDNTIVYQDATTGVSILFATDGILQCILEPNTLAAAGIVKCELHRSINNIQLSTNVFYFTISSGIGDNPTISQSYISAIETEVASITAEENTRIASEDSRSIAETARMTAEGLRVVAETSRVNDNTSYKVLEVYNVTHAYVPLNSVTYGGSTYQNILACTDILPTNTTNWVLTAQAGSGTNVTSSVTNGHIGINGIDTKVYDDTLVAKQADLVITNQNVASNVVALAHKIQQTN